MIGPTIQRLRMERLLTLTDIASCTGISRSYLENIERDMEGRPPVLILDKICRALRISIPCLLRNSGRMETELSSLDDSFVSLAGEATFSGISKEQFRGFLEFELIRRRECMDR